MNNKRAKYLPYIGYCLDDSLNVRDLADMPKGARLVVYGAGFEPLVVAVWSYLSADGSGLDEQDAEEIATDYLLECGWSDDQDLQAIDVV